MEAKPANHSEYRYQEIEHLRQDLFRKQQQINDLLKKLFEKDRLIKDLYSRAFEQDRIKELPGDCKLRMTFSGDY